MDLQHAIVSVHGQVRSPLVSIWESPLFVGFQVVLAGVDLSTGLFAVLVERVWFV